MNIIANRLQELKPSPTLAISQKTRELRAAGKDIVDLGAGEPDFDTPEHIKQAAKDAMDRGETKYTAVGGTIKLKQAVIDKFKRENDVEYALDEVMVSNGAKQILFNAFLATLNPGDEVVIPAPYWVSYPDIVTIAGGCPVIVPTSEDNGFILTKQALENAITPRTKWIILNSPNNPTGSAYGNDELKSLLEVVEQYPQLNLLSDEIYEHLAYDNFKVTSPITLAPHLKDRMLIINGVSKSFAMTGWRIGYVGGAKRLIKAMTNLQSQSTSNPSSISQAAAIAALNEPKDFLDEWLIAFRQRRDFVVERINACKGLSYCRPEGAFYIYVNCADIIGKQTTDGKIINNDAGFAALLLEEGIAVVPGIAFGCSPYFRISYATSMENLEKAMDRLDSACNKIN
jgi:aspartate aminotransferase